MNADYPITTGEEGLTNLNRQHWEDLGDFDAILGSLFLSHRNAMGA